MGTNELMINDLVYRKPHEEFHKKVPQTVVKIDGIEPEMVTIAPRSEYLDVSFNKQIGTGQKELNM